MIRRLSFALLLALSLSPAFGQAPPPIPALPDTERRTSYSITSSTCSCSVGFALYGDSIDYNDWLEVWLNGALVNYDDANLGWTITSPTGPLASIPRPITDAVLTFNNAQTGTIQIVGARRPRRTSQFQEGVGVPARNLNQVFTDIIAMLREVWDKINDVTGRGVFAPPGETMATLPPAAQRAGQSAGFDSNGNLVPVVGLPSGSVTAGDGIAFTGSAPTVISSNIQGSGPIDITGTNPLTIGCPTCVTASSQAPIFASRTAAEAADLSVFPAVTTLGYASAGDGGGATFKNVGTSPFVEQSVQACTSIVGGSGYTAGTYRAVPLTGGTGQNAIALVVVTGTTVSSVTITNWGGNGFTANDVLSATAANIGGTGTGFSCVATVNAALGSFIDSVGTHFQIVRDASGTNNVLQFGVKMDSQGAGSGTDATASLFNALQYAGLQATPGATVDDGGSTGSRMIVPAGSASICPTTKPFQIPFGVKFEGANVWSTSLNLCPGFANTSQDIFDLGDPQSHLACFGTQVSNMTVFATSVGATANTPIFFSNCIQQMNAFYRVVIYSGARSCIELTTGYGGAATIGLEQIECDPNAAINSSPGIAFAGFGSTILKLKDVNVETGGAGNAPFAGVQISTGGILDIDGFHTEGIEFGIVNALGGAIVDGSVRIHNATGGSGCTDLVLKQSSAASGDMVVGTAFPNGCTNTVTTSSGPTTTPIIADTLF